MTSRTDLSSELVVLASRLIRLVRVSLDQPAGARVLALVDQHGPMSITALAQADQCTQPTMSSTVNDLVERGWVRKLAHPEDARSTIVQPTKKGQAALAEIRQHNARLVTDRLGRHTDDELATAVALLRTITEHEPEGAR